MTQSCVDCHVGATLLCVMALACAASCAEPKERIVVREVEVTPDRFVAQIDCLREEISRLEARRDSLRDETDNYDYGLKVKLKQSRFSLDIAKHAKDAMNSTTFWISTDRETWQRADVGDQLMKSFRVGSFLTEGTTSSWSLTIADKRKEPR